MPRQPGFLWLFRPCRHALRAHVSRAAMKIIRALPFALLAACAACNDNSLETRPYPPVAVIEGPATASPLDVVLFDGSASYVEQSVIEEWEWSLTKLPGGSHADLSPDPADPRKALFSVDIAGDYEITLRVVDERGMDDSEVFRFSAVPWQTVHIEITWDTDGTDVDLHLVSETEGGSFYSEPFDCYYENTNPDWGVAGITVDDPAIDIDDVDGFGPEHVSLNEPLEGHRYRVAAHYFDDRGLGSTTATVRIYLSGHLRYEGIRPLERTGSGWDVATIDWPTGGVVGLDQSFDYAP